MVLVCRARAPSPGCRASDGVHHAADVRDGGDDGAYRWPTPRPAPRPRPPARLQQAIGQREPEGLIAAHPGELSRLF
jgi:hypothetical protein